MSQFTTELRNVVNQTLDDANLPRSEANWYAAYKIIGLDDYPIFDEAYRQTLNDKIVRHYWMREIGGETVALFRLFLRRAMHEIMPYYNQMYESLAVANGIDPLIGKKLSTTEGASGTSTSNAAMSSTTSSDGSDIYSDTPQSALNLINIKEGKYASTADFTTAATSDSSNSDASGTYVNDLNRLIAGHEQPEAELLLLWRKTFVNIDLEIIESEAVRECFMGIW